MSYGDLRKGRYSENWRAYFVTTVLCERQQKYFSDLFLARLLVAEMRALHEAGTVNSLAWVVMPDHLHWLFQLGDSDSLAAVMKGFKARSAHRVNKHLQRQGALWQKGYYDYALRAEDDVQQIARYIVANPIRAGLVKYVSDYALWDAAWL